MPKIDVERMLLAMVVVMVVAFEVPSQANYKYCDRPTSSTGGKCTKESNNGDDCNVVVTPSNQMCKYWSTQGYCTDNGNGTNHIVTTYKQCQLDADGNSVSCVATSTKDTYTAVTISLCSDV